jgi:hypothetical protein
MRRRNPSMTSMEKMLSKALHPHHRAKEVANLGHMEVDSVEDLIPLLLLVKASGVLARAG